MQKQNTRYTIGIHPTKCTSLPLRHIDNAYQQEKVNKQKEEATNKSKRLSQGSKDKVGMLLRYILTPCLCTLQKATSIQSTRANGNLTLAYIIIIRFYNNLVFTLSSLSGPI